MQTIKKVQKHVGKRKRRKSTPKGTVARAKVGVSEPRACGFLEAKGTCDTQLDLVNNKNSRRRTREREYE